MSQGHGINIPGVLLDALKERDYSNDDRFNKNTKVNKRKRDSQRVGRKERRKQQRLEKKHKGKNLAAESEEKPFVKKPSSKRKPTKTSTKIPAKSNVKNENKLPFSSDDELSSGDFDDFDEGDLNEEEWEQLRQLEDDDEDDSDDDDEDERNRNQELLSSDANESEDNLDSNPDDFEEEEEMTVEETMKKLKALKKSKGNEIKHDLDKDKGEKLAENNDDESYEIDSMDDDEADEEEDEMTVEETMTALKALKKNKSKKSIHDLSGKDEKKLPESSNNESESVSDIDSMSESFEEDGQEMTVEETMEALKALKKNKKNSKHVSFKKDTKEASDSSDYESDSKIDFDSASDISDGIEEEMSVEETMAALKALKKNKNKNADETSSEEKIKEDSEISDDESNSELNSDMADESFEEEDEEMTVEETMNKLKALKNNKGKFASHKSVEEPSLDESESDEEESDGIDLMEESEDDNEPEMTVEETMAALKALKKNKDKKNDEKSKKTAKKSTKKTEEEVYYPLPPSDRAAEERDEMEMQYYAKKLKLKGAKKTISAKDEYDAIGGLLEGLDYFENYGENDEEYGDFGIKGHDQRSASESDSEISGGDEDLESEDDEDNEISNVKTPFSSDDELSSGDFDEFDENDLNEDEWEQLRELEESESDESGDEPSRKSKKVNPYVASNQEEPAGSYVPPSLRKKQLEMKQDSAVVIEIRKLVKSSLNKLSETNISVIVTSLNELYDRYPRQYVTEVITSQLLAIVSQNNKLLNSFICVHTAVAYSLWKLRGIEVGASFIQHTVEKFLALFEAEQEVVAAKRSDKDDDVLFLSKECSNLLTMLAYCYNFNMITSKLIFNIVSMLVKFPNEFTTDLLLRVVSVSGPLIRGDDPSALKDIISELLANVKGLKSQGPRLKFLLDTMTDLKNNRLKPSILASSHQPIKKSLQSLLRSSQASEALQVSLEDIQNVETKGKWWLVGSSWRGNMNSAFEEGTDTHKITENASKLNIEDNLLDEIPDWVEISRQQRMNTDIRRAIFISIMSSQDFLEAFTKLEKLNLKNKQVAEIPKVLIHCLKKDCAENGYNPYYSLVANKLCEQHHNLYKTFQFLFWDTVKNFENDSIDGGLNSSDEEEEENDEDQRLKKILAQGKFFGSLLSEGILHLDILKHVPIIGGLNADGILFVELLVFQMLLSIARKSESRNKKDSKGNRQYTYSNQRLVSAVTQGIKSEEKQAILTSLKYFLRNKFNYKTYLTGSKTSKEYKRDSRRLQWAVPEFTSLVKMELENTE